MSNIHFELDLKFTVNMNDYVGGVVNTNYGFIENVWVSGELSLPGQKYIGGVVGVNYGNIRNCENTAVVTCADYAGGIAGYNNGIIAFCVNNERVTAVIGTTDGNGSPYVKHSGSIAGYVGAGTQLNGCITTVADIDARNPLYGETHSPIDFSLSVLVNADNLDTVLFEWLNYDPKLGDLYNEDNMPVNRDEGIWYNNTGRWVRAGDKPKLAIFNK